MNAALDRAIRAGAIKEQVYESAGQDSIAFCADPFGNGFCILQSKAREG